MCYYERRIPSSFEKNETEILAWVSGGLDQKAGETWMGSGEVFSKPITDKCQKYNVEEKKSDTCKYILYDSIYIKVKNRQNSSVGLEVRIYLLWWRRMGS